MAISVHWWRSGAIAHVCLTHEQTVSLAGALAGLVLERGAEAWRVADDP